MLWLSLIELDRMLNIGIDDFDALRFLLVTIVIDQGLRIAFIFFLYAERYLFPYFNTKMIHKLHHSNNF